MNFSPTHYIRGNAVLKALLSLLVILAVSGALYGTYTWQHRKVDKLETQVTQLQADLSAATKNQTAATLSGYTSGKGVSIKVYAPADSSQLTSPVIVLGEVPGNWSFEASFPVKLLDSKGKVIAQASAQLLGDWMTDKPVPFSAKLTFSGTPSGNGTLVLQKDNPSGLATNDDSVSIPIKF